MTSSEISAKISENNKIIATNEAEKQQLEETIEELIAMNSKMISLQNVLGEEKTKSDTNLKTSMASGISNKIYTRYYDGMSELLSGSEFQKSCTGLDEASQVIVAEKQKQLDALQTCEATIAKYRTSNVYWAVQLEIAKLKEMQVI